MIGVMRPRSNLMTLREVGDFLHVSRRTVRRLIDAGRLPVLRLGLTARAWRIDPDALAQFVSEEQECLSEKRPIRATRNARGSSKSIETGNALDAALGLDVKPSKSSAKLKPRLVWIREDRKPHSSNT